MMAHGREESSSPQGVQATDLTLSKRKRPVHIVSPSIPAERLTEWQLNSPVELQDFEAEEFGQDTNHRTVKRRRRNSVHGNTNQDSSVVNISSQLALAHMLPGSHRVATGVNPPKANAGMHIIDVLLAEAISKDERPAKYVDPANTNVPTTGASQAQPNFSAYQQYNLKYQHGSQRTEIRDCDATSLGPGQNVQLNVVDGDTEKEKKTLPSAALARQRLAQNANKSRQEPLTVAVGSQHGRRRFSKLLRNLFKEEPSCTTAFPQATSSAQIDVLAQATNAALKHAIDSDDSRKAVQLPRANVDGSEKMHGPDQETRAISTSASGGPPSSTPIPDGRQVSSSSSATQAVTSASQRGRLVPSVLQQQHHILHSAEVKSCEDEIPQSTAQSSAIAPWGSPDVAWFSGNIEEWN